MGELKGGLASAIHLCIDMQRLFAPGGPWPTPWMERVLPRVTRLAAHAPAHTIFTRFVTPHESDAMPGMWQAYYRKWPDVLRGRIDETLFNLMPELDAFAPPAKVFDKHVYSAFADGRLHTTLQKAGISTVIVTGSETDVCVLSSVLNAIDLGYRVVIARDAVCSSSDEAHDALIGLYAKRFEVQIALSGIDEIMEAWRPG